MEYLFYYYSMIIKLLDVSGKIRVMTFAELNKSDGILFQNDLIINILPTNRQSIKLVTKSWAGKTIKGMP